MEDTELFQIGEVAKMFHLSVGTLRHYEQTGLLKPEYIDKHTGYRYYSVRQFEVLTNIRYLRALDMPLNQIREFIRNRDVEVIAEKLQSQREMIAQKKRELEVIERKIEHRIRQLEDARNSVTDQIQVVKMPPSRIVWIRDSLKWKSYLSLEHSIRRLEEHQKVPLTYQGKAGVGVSKENLLAHHYERYDRVFLLLDEEDTYEGTVDEFPESYYVTMRFHGSHGDSPQYYKKLLDKIQKENMEIMGFSRELALIDNVYTNKTEQFITEISIPVHV